MSSPRSRSIGSMPSKLANTFSGGAREDETHAPRTGEHTREVLSEAGYAAPEIDALLAAGAVR